MDDYPPFLNGSTKTTIKSLLLACPSSTAWCWNEDVLSIVSVTIFQAFGRNSR